MKKSYRFIIDVSIIIGYILLFYWSFGIFGGPVGVYSGFPKGDDAHTHAGWIRFVLENWSNHNWSPNWYSGFPIFLSYHPLSYYIWAFFIAMTGFSIESTLFFFTALSYCLIGIGLYAFVYRITKNHESAIITPLLLIVSSGFFGQLTVGGTYTRVFATMFWMFSLWSLVSYIETKKKGYFISTIILMTCIFTSDILIGFNAALTNVLILIFCLKDFKNKILQLFKVFVPTAGLSTFFYLPFLDSYLNRFISFTIRGNHYSIPWSLLSFISASLFPIVFSFIGTVIVRFKKIKFNHITSGTLKALIVMNAFFIFHTLTDFPLRLFASYDGVYFFPILCSIYSGILFGLIFNQINTSSILHFYDLKSKIPNRSIKTLPFITLFCIISLSIMIRPMLIENIVDPGVKSWDNAIYCIEQLVEFENDEKNYRLATDWIHATRLFHYKYNIPQTSGVHPMGILYPDWNYWFEDTVFTYEDNLKEMKFLLDWYAVKWLIVSKAYASTGVHYAGGGELFKRSGLIDKFLNNPELFEVNSSIEVPQWSYWGGPMYLFEYKLAAPILSNTNATSILVIGVDMEYDNIFRSLAYSEYNDGFYIPIRGSEHFNELERFDITILYDYDYSKSEWLLLQDYVESGGNLFIIDSSHSNVTSIPLPSPVENVINMSTDEWNFTWAHTQVTDWIDFDKFAQPDEYSAPRDRNIRPWATEILWNDEHPIAIIGEYGIGRVVWTGLNLPQYSILYKNTPAALLFSTLLDWISNTPGKNTEFDRRSSESVIVSRPNPEFIKIRVDDASSGVLFKESYINRWSAYQIDADGRTQSLNIYRAGPDFMYAPLLDDVKFPIDIIFEYNISDMEWFSYILSTLTLVGLLIYGFSLPIDRLIKRLLKN